MKMNDLHELFESFHLLTKQFFIVEPRYNEALHNEVSYTTKDVLYPSNKKNSQIYLEPRESE